MFYNHKRVNLTIHKPSNWKIGKYAFQFAVEYKIPNKYWSDSWHQLCIALYPKTVWHRFYSTTTCWVIPPRTSSVYTDRTRRCTEGIQQMAFDRCQYIPHRLQVSLDMFQSRRWSEIRCLDEMNPSCWCEQRWPWMRKDMYVRTCGIDTMKEMRRRESTTNTLRHHFGIRETMLKSKASTWWNNTEYREEAMGWNIV